MGISLRKRAFVCEVGEGPKYKNKTVPRVVRDGSWCSLPVRRIVLRMRLRQRLGLVGGLRLSDQPCRFRHRQRSSSALSQRAIDGVAQVEKSGKRGSAAGARGGYVSLAQLFSKSSNVFHFWPPLTCALVLMPKWNTGHWRSQPRSR